MNLVITNSVMKYLLLVISCLLTFISLNLKHLKELQNFNGLMAVAGGLTNTALNRLRQTQELLSQDCKEVPLKKIIQSVLNKQFNSQVK